MSNLTIESPIKVITSGNKPTTGDVLSFGQLAVGKITEDGSKVKMFANIGQSEDEIVEVSSDSTYENTLGELTVPNAVGGIKAGTSAEDLEGLTITQLFNKLLFPVVQPTIQTPSASISFKDTFSNNGVYEVGSTAPSAEKFNTGFNKGTVTCPGIASTTRAGELRPGDSYIIYGTSDPGSSQDLPLTIAYGQMQYKYKALYEQGPELKDSQGGKATVDPNPLPAGSVMSSAISIYGVYPIFANTTSSTQLTKLSLTNNTYAEFTCVAETDDGRHQFAIPQPYTLSKIEYFDTVANTYKPINISNFDESTVEQSIAAGSKQYKLYKRNEAGKSGSTKFKITFTKADY